MTDSPAQLPATVAVALIVDCQTLDETPQPHRVWVHRDGTVTVPDHQELETQAEQVVSALGGDIPSACSYWLHAPKLKANAPVIPDRASWRIADTEMVSTKSTWTLLTGILGEQVRAALDPVAALAHVQAYLLAGGLPDDPVTHLGYLMAPWTRSGGYRRLRATTPEELQAMLAAGVPITRAASACALDASAQDSAAAMKELARLNLPADTWILMLHALPGAQAVQLLRALPADSGKQLAADLRSLGAHLQGTPVPTRGDIPALLSAAQ